jgi:gamma-glutamyltranspeptidase/glutathione hydrolase
MSFFNILRSNGALSFLTAFVSLGISTAQAVPAQGHRMLVTGPSPYSIQIVKDISAKGGNVVDALVAAALELGVTHPYYASLGGGGFALVKMGHEKTALDFREMAPTSANPETYKGKDPKASLTGGLAVGVPGVAAGLYELHKKYGKLKWARVVEPAIRLAEDGFEVSGEWSFLVNRNHDRFTKDGQQIFFSAKNAEPLRPGDRFRQPALAKFLKRYAKEGAKAFYQGPAAKEIVDLVNQTGGVYTKEDLANYKVRWLKPLATTFMGYDVTLMPPPSSGGIVIAQALRLTEKTKLAEKTQPLSVGEYHGLIEIEKLSYRNRIALGDPDFAKNPIDELMKEVNLDHFAAMIKPDKAIPSASLLSPEEKKIIENAKQEKPETTHISVMDTDGNTVAMTVTLNGDFGSGLVTKSGIALNNEMDDFTTHPGKPNMFGLIQGEANVVRAGARPLSSMSPTIVEKEGQTVLSLGAPGGPRIISAVFQVIYRTLARGLDVDVAIQTPRVHHQFLPDVVKTDANKLPPESIAGLKALGHQVEFSSTAKVYAIQRAKDGTLSAAADARGEGAAGGN